MYSYVYISSSAEGEIICSGIKFYEFYKFLEPKFENMVLLKGDYFGNSRARNFELFLGKEEIKSLSSEMEKAEPILGDFHFMDFAAADSICQLTNEEIKDILYLSHMWQAIDSPFFETLQNHFVYLAHDDDWYCKLHVRNPDDILNIIIRKIESYVRYKLKNKANRKEQKYFRNKDKALFLRRVGDNVPEIRQDIKGRIFEKWNEGLFFDLSGMQISANKIVIKTYIIGEFGDMDEMFNNIEHYQENSSQVNSLCFTEEGWIIS